MHRGVRAQAGEGIEGGAVDVRVRIEHCRGVEVGGAALMFGHQGPEAARFRNVHRPSLEIWLDAWIPLMMTARPARNRDAACRSLGEGTDCGRDSSSPTD